MTEAATAPQENAPAEAPEAVSPCGPDCQVHPVHQAVVLGPDGRYYPAPVVPRKDPTKIGRLVNRIVNGPAWLAPLALLVCVSLPISYVLTNNPTDAEPDLGACAFKLVTGFDCPGCGGTRALWYLLHANLPEAARYHAVAVFAAPFLAYMYLSWAWRRMFPNARVTLPKLKFGPNTVSVFLAVWGVFWVIRNLPWAPFTNLYV
ncbi:DUF2752 domain-containing protein [Phytomonospora sp. NPDC050363]|uniref:DUF2752 domain-containing protein n=1 Tax=Phytomonospora sp. NPDC050363 TaxID=3155642 RepID=UPI00340699EC